MRDRDTDSLIERARLTDWEMFEKRFDVLAIADAQLTKALWVVEEWLNATSRAFPESDRAWCGARLLAEKMKATRLYAGIKSPYRVAVEDELSNGAEGEMITILMEATPGAVGQSAAEMIWPSHCLPGFNTPQLTPEAIGEFHVLGTELEERSDARS